MTRTPAQNRIPDCCAGSSVSDSRTRQDQWTERYLLCEQLVDPRIATDREKFAGTARFIRDLIAHRWVRTRRSREQHEHKRIHYLSLEFLLGRTLRNNIIQSRRRTAGPARAGAGGVESRGAHGRRGGRRPRQWRPRAPGGLFHRFAGQHAVRRHWLWPALPVRNFSTGDSRRLAGRTTRHLAAQSRSVGNRPARSRLRGAAECQLRAARRDPQVPARPSYLPGGRGLRSAGGRISAPNA